MNRPTFVLIALLASSAAAEDATVRKFHDAFFAAWNEGDADALVERLTEDTVYHPMGAETLVGRDVIGGSYRSFIDSFNVRMDVTPEVLDAYGDHGMMQGTYTSTLTPKDGRPGWSRSGRYHMDLVRNVDGDWRIAREVTQMTADPTPRLMAEANPTTSDGEVRRRFADIDEGQVHYWQGGPAASNKTPLLFLHPGPHSARVQKPLLDAIATHRPVYAPDIMGMGDSSPPPHLEPDLSYFADAVLRFADATGLESFALYGSNLSARIGVEIALQQPERVRTLILNRMVFFEGDTLATWAAGHVPNVQPDQEGAYVTFLWSRLRDLNTYVPWFQKGAENLRGKGLPSADILHLSFVEQVKMAPTMHLAFDAYWAYPLIEKLLHLKVQTTVTEADAKRVPDAEIWAPTPLGGNVISATPGALAARAAQFDKIIGD
ncbi:MAG: alpha/beta fold hydrolase [Alphaproteobacteria bacterium]|nr:alpha/beta fold hydrolase [Alphaproteobacteria bacterium]